MAVQPGGIVEGHESGDHLGVADNKEICTSEQASGNPADGGRLLHDVTLLGYGFGSQSANTTGTAGLERRDGLWHKGTPM
jgi:hypothetical protein